MAAGAGYLDPQGVWRYGEDDLETLASDMLNLGQISLSQQLALDRARLVALESTAWVPLTLLNSWTPYGGIWGTPSYRRHGRTVEFKGAMKTSGSTAAVFATLPAGYCPAGQTNVEVRSLTAWGSCDIGSSGGMNLRVIPAGGNSFLSLDGVSFGLG